MAEVRLICVWKDLLPQIFPTSCGDYNELWNDIAKERVHVINIGEKGYAALSVDPISLHVHCIEGFQCLDFEAMREIARGCGRHTITAEVQKSGRLMKVLKRRGFVPVWQRDNTVRLMKVLNG